MIDRVLSILFFISFFHCSFAQNLFDIANVRQLGLITVDITTVNGEIPTCDYASAPEGSMGETCINQTKVHCRIVIYDHDNVLYDSGEYEKGVSGATIKINGNTSSFYNNKPYKLKLQKKADLLQRGNQKYADKNWRLIKDILSLNTIIGLKVNELLELPWTPTYKPCNVFLNNEYQGCYLLIESVKRNSDCRLNVDKETGYIVERDAYWWKEDKYFETDFFSQQKAYRWTWKYPDEEDVTAEQEQYIRDYINKTEESIVNGTYDQYIDVLSFAKWLLAHDILGTWDSGGSNLFVMKYDNTDNTLLQMANLWDFDTCFRMAENKFSRYHQGSYDYYFPSLFESTNHTFSNTYRQLWNEKKDLLQNNLLAYIENYINSDEAQAIQRSRELHAQRWHFDIDSVQEDGIFIKKWLTHHFEFLDQMINTQTAIHIISSNDSTNKDVYNLFGIKTKTPINKGIYISNGKKYFSYPFGHHH